MRFQKYVPLINVKRIDDPIVVNPFSLIGEIASNWFKAVQQTRHPDASICSQRQRSGSAIRTFHPIPHATPPGQGRSPC
jgi:hypothetical protein